ncbi:hypothetical protein PIB30_079051 [Stylosanthes scabra]|uniref:Uncharacterized protein n=1 Tax=Stylosanthes scabra TaxID=79078 RepID=A0ABU6QTB4_9FABA|nr:hypothetical protein [Stylosanthes scabra]
MGFSKTEHPCGRTNLKLNIWESLSRACDRATPPCNCTVKKTNYGWSLSPSCRRTLPHVPAHGSCARAVPPCELTVGRVALDPICNFRRALARFNPCDRTGPKTESNGPPNRACNHASGPCTYAGESAALKSANFNTLISLLSFSLKSLYSQLLKTSNYTHTQPLKPYYCV